MMRIHLLLGIAALSARPVAAQNPPKAVADGVTYQGQAQSAGLAVFRGIPYAEPPVGPLRWRPPTPLPQSSGVQPAVKFASICMQTNRLRAWTRGIAATLGTEQLVKDEPFEPSEDCLYLNVWTRSLGAEPAPVMVWIHGGSNLSGAGSSPGYDGGVLGSRGVVVVTINYRLGVFGFLAHPGIGGGNYGLLDQLEALRWVKRNIRGFGGDPDRVTVFGESAGAIDIVHLMTAPAARGLFHRAIAQSGAPMAAVPTRSAGEAFGVRFAIAAGVDSSTDVATALRAKPAAEINMVQDRLLLMGATAGVVIDGEILPDQTGPMFDRGEQARVPLLIGTNSLEMATLQFYLPRFTRTVAGFMTWVSATFGASAERIGQLYPVEKDADVNHATLRLATDLYFTCPARMAARAAVKVGSPAFRYQFTRVFPGGESLGAFHGAEIGYVFGVAPPWLPRQPGDDALSRAMMDYWTRFAASGQPGGSGTGAWPASGTSGDPVLELTVAPAARVGLATDRCDAIEPAIRRTWVGPP